MHHVLQVGEICHFTERRDQEKFARELVDGEKGIISPAIIHGRMYESTAIKAFEAASSNKVRKCG